MKIKAALLLPALLVLHSAVFGADFSLGGGGRLGLDLTRYRIRADGASKADLNQHLTQLDYGAFFFFDAKWVEAALLIQRGDYSFNEFGDPVPDIAGTGTEAAFGLSLLGKYPFTPAAGFSVFPLLGVEYRIALLELRKPEGAGEYDRSEGKYPDEFDSSSKPLPLSAWNSLWIILGAGADYDISPAFYLRGELLYGVRLQTGHEKNALELVKRLYGDNSPDYSGLSGGPSFKIALGCHLPL